MSCIILYIYNLEPKLFAYRWSFVTIELCKGSLINNQCCNTWFKRVCRILKKKLKIGLSVTWPKIVMRKCWKYWYLCPKYLAFFGLCTPIMFNWKFVTFYLYIRIFGTAVNVHRLSFSNENIFLLTLSPTIFFQGEITPS